MLTLAMHALLGAAAVGTTDWPQWRGPSRDAVASSASSSRSWPVGLVAKWRSRVGDGQSSPVVQGDTVFVFSREDGKEIARALHLETGRTIWSQSYPAPYRVYPGAASYGAGPKSTPVVYGGRLFTLGIGGIVTAFDAKDGRIQWQKDFAGRFSAPAPPFGASMSPLVAAGRLVVHVGGHDGGALIAFDPATGAEVWTVTGEGPSYSSPILASFDGQEHIVVQVHRKVIGVDPASGKTLWSLPFVTPCDQNIVTPLSTGDVIVLSSVDQGTQGIRPTRRGAAFVPEVVWHTNEVSLYMSSPVWVKGRVIGLSHKKKGQYFALDPATGAVSWKSDPARGENAAFVVVDGSLLVLEGDGTLLVGPADGAAFVPSRRYRVAEGATYAHPVPTRLGVLIKDADGLSLYGDGPATAASRP